MEAGSPSDDIQLSHRLSDGKMDIDACYVLRHAANLPRVPDASMGHSPPNGPRAFAKCPRRDHECRDKRHGRKWGQLEWCGWRYAEWTGAAMSGTRARLCLDVGIREYCTGSERPLGLLGVMMILFSSHLVGGSHQRYFDKSL
jgi:hypothetical protein